MAAARSRTLLRGGLLALGVAAAGAAVWISANGARGPAAAPAPRGIILFCVDTLRGDGFSPPGALPGPMPRLQAFAAESALFVDASAPSAWTAPSVTSLLTGLLPSEHGVQAFGKASPLISSVTTVAEMLQSAGWSTAAATGGGWVSPDLGLGQGFDQFSVTFDDLGAQPSIELWDKARPKDRPFFLFLHTYAAHDPYGHHAWMRHGPGSLRPAATLAPPDLVAGLERGGGLLPPDLLTPYCLQHLTNTPGRLACSQAIGAPRYDELWRNCMDWLDGGYAKLGDRAAIEAAVRDSYRAGLPSADEVIGDALATLESRGVLDHADVIFVGDHGEEFGEHLALSHGLNLYDEVLRVPLLVRAPGRIREGIVRGSVNLLDVTPTILDLAGVPAPAGLEGASLVALARSEAPGRPVVAELERGSHPDRPLVARFKFVSVRTEQAKWIVWFDPVDGRVVREELYDLGADPKESTSLDASQGMPARFGRDFCRKVAEQRNLVRRLAGLAPVEASCGAPR